MELQTVSLNSKHNRENFECGKDSLNDYLKKQANQDIKKKLAACFVITENQFQKEEIKGYYTLSNSSIPRECIPESYQKKFPRSYDTIPATLIGRLARDVSFTGKGIGEFLLMDALYRSFMASKELGSFAVVVDPIDEYAEKFYFTYGFIKLPDSGKMFLPMRTIEQLF